MLATQHVSAAVSIYRNIQYRGLPGVDPNLLSLDIYVPDGANGTNPVMVMYHGGGFTQGDKTGEPLIHPKMDYYTSLGWVFISVNYRLTDPSLPIDDPNQVTHPDHIDDVAHSIAWILDNINDPIYGGDPDRVVLMGHSAGAHIIALVATDERRLTALGHSLADIKGVIALDGMYDIPYRYKQIIPPPPYMVLVWGADSATQQDMSPIYFVTPEKNIPPMLVVHRDDQITVEQSTRFVDALKANGFYTAMIYDAVGLNHAEIGRNIGIPCEALSMTVDGFLDDLGLKLPSVYDIDQNGKADIEDLYEIIQHPQDINGDGVSDSADVLCVESFVRRHETDMTSNRQP